MIEERVAILETKVQSLETYNQDILSKLDEIGDTLTRYRGFIGGIVFVGSCFVTFLTFAKDYIKGFKIF